VTGLQSGRRKLTASPQWRWHAWSELSTGEITTLVSHSSDEIRWVKGSRYSLTERRVPELIPVLGSQHAGDVSHKHGGRLPLLSARPAVTPAILKRAATNLAAW